ncbi:MAG: hypothetical protein GEV09_24580 [Pseudonocardiaceae bacterium]|nr:hypothetical protein [Pseudonocardiaceae bacterium]
MTSTIRHGARLTAALVLAATAVNSYLAVVGLDRVLVAMPAWQKAGPLTWAEFSRYADNGPVALVLYPALAFGGLLLTTASAVSHHRDKLHPRGAGLPIYLALLGTIGGLLATIKAAANMLAVPDLGRDAAGLQMALDNFHFWGNIRAGFQVLAFAAGLWAMTEVFGGRTR